MESQIDAGMQADFPEPDEEEQELKIKPLERIKLHPKAPIEPSTYSKYSNYSRPWILQDGRDPPKIGSIMRQSYKTPKKPPNTSGFQSSK